MKRVIITLLFIIASTLTAAYCPAGIYGEPARPGGFDVYVSKHVGFDGTLLQEQFPAIMGMGGAFHLPIGNFVTLCTKFDYLGIANSAAQTPPPYLSAFTLSKMTVSECVRVHALFFRYVDLYAQAGLAYTSVSGRAVYKGGWTNTTTGGMLGAEVGVGAKVMLLHWLGVYGEGVWHFARFGDAPADNMGGFRVNVGLYFGMLREDARF